MSRPRVLAFCTTALGDTLLCTPALKALGRAFDLDVVVHRRRIPLLLGNPAVKLIYPYRNNFLYRLGLSWRLGRTPYHRLLVLHANDDVLKLIRELKFERGANLQGWDRPRWNLEALRFPETPHIIDQRLALAAWAGAPVQGDEVMEIFLSREEWQQGREWLEQRGLGRPLAALCPGASHAFKRWPAPYFARLARDLADRGVGVLLVGSADEAGLLEEVAETEEKIVRAAGLELRLLAAVLAGADLLISNCTGPLHLAQAVGTPVLGLYGPTDPRAIGPRGRPHRVLQVPPACDPCLKKKCPRTTCLDALAPETVLETALEMLGLGGEI